MKHILKHLRLFFIFILIILNGYFFIHSMTLEDNLLQIEKKTRILKLENTELETKVSSLNSLSRLQKIATNLDFIKKQDLLYLDNLQYAFRHE